MTKFEMAMVIFDGNRPRAAQYARNTDKETVTRLYNKTIEKQNKRTVLPEDKFSALETALYKRNRHVYCEAVYNTSPVEFQISWCGTHGNIEDATKFVNDLKDAINLAGVLNGLNIVVDENARSGENYYDLIERYSKIVEHYYWLEIDDVTTL